MREIKLVGQKKLGNRKYLVGVFECDECGSHIEKIAKDGRKAKYCSHACYAKNRCKRGPYQDSVIISGYRYIYSPSHPHKIKKGYVAEHRLVAEIKINRKLKPGEVVHHIDENKLNNHPDNLMVLTNSDHIKLHKSKSHKPCPIDQ